MLKGIDNRLNADVLYALRAMGHGDLLVVADTNFPADSIARDTVLVAGQRSDEIASLALDARTGAPGRMRHRTIAPSPTAILPFPV